ncbi:MAG: hypothetical protein IKN71_05555 [Alphaproteobacteria bacterium]|nr:hypothetical protein [Alphaproteobacteria bacterium]
MAGENENTTIEVEKITTPVTPLQQVNKINEIIDALAAIQISAGADIDGGIIGDSLDNEIDGGTL